MPDALSMPRIAVHPVRIDSLPRNGAVSAQFPIRAGKEPRFFSSYPARRA
ncbi:hypothetical protein [Burkholderia cenocepacia]|nr:hypothetical protein [Burkholderia cenocepacia]MBR8075600.1 hypothetical protein [Burkholderia cenocepacia]